MRKELIRLVLEKGYTASFTDPSIVTVQNPQNGFALARFILEREVDKKTVLFLSGGKTPKELYESLSTEEQFQPGAVSLIDERYGDKMHEQSNERMLSETGFLKFLQYRNISFYPILQSSHPGEATTSIGSHGDSIASLQNDSLSLVQTAEDFDETARFLFNGFPKSVGILGIGLDGHTAGIPAGRKKLAEREKQAVATWYGDFPGEQKRRISLTFLGLSKLDVLLVLVFGEEKKKALKQMLAEGSEEEIPSRFFKRPEIAQKTLLITDQKV